MARRLAAQFVLIAAVIAGRPIAGWGQVRFSDEARQGRTGPAVVLAGAQSPTSASSHESADAQDLAPADPQSAGYLPVDEGPVTYAYSDEAPVVCGPDGCPPSLGSRLFADAWLEQGVTINTDSPHNRFNTPVGFNDRSNDYQMNQAYLSLGRSVMKGGCGWDVGAQVDLVYGADYFFTTALGLETEDDGTQRWNSDNGPRGAALYGLAMPQLFADVYAPLGAGVSVKMGHFYTILGYETVTAPQNFFYSHSYAFLYGEPKTHTGLLADVPLASRLSVQAGFTRGWDTWEDPQDASGFLGGLNWTSWDQRSTLTFAIHTGRESQPRDQDRTVYSLLLTHHFTPCLTYVFQHDLGTESNAEIEPNGQLGSAKWYGINQYLYLALSPQTSLGLRVEWFRDQDNARVLGIPIQSDVNGGNYTELTFGANWKPRPFMTFRPELRWDSSNVTAPNLGLDGMFIDFTQNNQLTLALDLILIL